MDKHPTVVNGFLPWIEEVKEKRDQIFTYLKEEILMVKNKNRLLFVALVTLLLIITSACANNNSTVSNDSSSEEINPFPEKEIILMVPYGAGGANDVIGRTVAKYASEYIGQPVVVENKPGAAGVAGLTELTTLKPDGYTIALTVPVPIAIQPHFGSSKITYEDIDPIAKLADFPQGLIVNKNAPWDNFDEWFEDVKANPRKFTYGTAGRTGQFLVMEEFKSVAGVDVRNIQYKSGGESSTALLGGHVDSVIAYTTVLPPEESKILATFTEKRVIENVPTFKEKGFDVVLDYGIGLVGPKGMPDYEKEYLIEAFRNVLEMPEAIKEIEEKGFKVDFASSKDYYNELAGNYKQFGDVIEELGLAK